MQQRTLPVPNPQRSFNTALYQDHLDKIQARIQYMASTTHCYQVETGTTITLWRYGMDNYDLRASSATTYPLAVFHQTEFQIRETLERLKVSPDTGWMTSTEEQDYATACYRTYHN